MVSSTAPGGGGLMRHATIIAVLLCVSCGGANESQAPEPAPDTAQPDDAVIAKIHTALASHELPVFPLQTPDFDTPTLDGQGVILDDSRQNAYHPSMIARYALRLYQLWRLDPSRMDYIASALIQTDWLVANLDCNGLFGVWRYPFAASFGAQPGWASGFGQAHGIVALLVLSRFVADPQPYLRAVLCATRAFPVDVADGGLLTPDRGNWYEEYAVASRPGVLNGHIFALAGLHYGCEFAEWEEFCTLFERGVEAVRARLPTYDAGFTSLYSLVEGNYASPAYNDLHGAALKWLHEVTADPVFSQYAEQFADYAAGTFTVTASHSSDADHGSQRLSDGLMWYGYWSGYRFPLTLDIDLPQEQSVRRLSLFFVGDEPAPFSFAADDGEFVAAGAPVITARHTTDVHRTTAAVYDVGVIARRVRLRFDAPLATGVMALRELDVLHY